MINFDLILTFPFYNEEKFLPTFLQSLASSRLSRRCYLIGVNHNSTDTSVKILNQYKNNFAKLKILREKSILRSVGIPRGTGLNFAMNEVKNLPQPYKEKIPIASIDSDTEVSKQFLKQIIETVPNKCDILAFPYRTNPRVLMQWATSQQDISTQNIAIHSLLGIEWLRYQFALVLANRGIIETRGPGGYALAVENLQKLNYKQPFNTTGEPVTGESNQLGIKAFKLNLNMSMSPYPNSTDPRRIIVSILNLSTNKGYKKDSEGSELFRLARTNEQEIFPQLTPTLWQSYLKETLYRTLELVITRTIAYNQDEYIEHLFPNNPVWGQIFREQKHEINRLKPSLEKLVTIGDSSYKQSFRKAISMTNTEEVTVLLHKIESLIPTNNKLIKWANKEGALTLNKEFLSKIQR